MKRAIDSQCLQKDLKHRTIAREPRCALSHSPSRVSVERQAIGQRAQIRSSPDSIRTVAREYMSHGVQYLELALIVKRACTSPSRLMAIRDVDATNATLTSVQYSRGLLQHPTIERSAQGYSIALILLLKYSSRSARARQNSGYC